MGLQWIYSRVEVWAYGGYIEGWAHRVYGAYNQMGAQGCTQQGKDTSALGL